MIPPPLVTCTVVTRSHFGFARAMARSLRRFNPGARSYVLILDCPRNEREAGMDEVIPVFLEDLRIPDLAAFCFQYSAFELCNALKSWLVRHVLRERGEPAALYLDGDIGVFASLEPLWNAVLAHEVLLTPHTTAPFPQDGKFPGTSNILCAGSYNAGVLGVRADGDGLRFLDWWAQCVRHDCITDHSIGLEVDQKFLELVPSLFPGHRVFRHDGVNVAHFNLHHRRLRLESGRWWCNEDPLLLFHFTQISLPGGVFFPLITRDFSSQSAELRQLATAYHGELTPAEWLAHSQRPYGFRAFESGRPISRETRSEFRRRWKSGGAPGTPNPFADPEWESFERGLRWRALPGRILGFLGRRLGRVLPSSAS